MLNVMLVAKMSKVTEGTVRRWIKAGLLPATIHSCKCGYSIEEKDYYDFITIHRPNIGCKKIRHNFKVNKQKEHACEKNYNTSYRYLNDDDYIIWRDCIRGVLGMLRLSLDALADELGIKMQRVSSVLVDKEHRVTWVMFYASMYALMGIVGEADIEDTTKDKAHRLILEADYMISQHRKEAAKHEGE